MADSSESTRGVQRREGMQAGLVGNVEENEDEDEDEDENSMKVDEPDQPEMPSTRDGSTMEERLRQCRPTVAGTLPWLMGAGLQPVMAHEAARQDVATGLQVGVSLLLAMCQSMEICSLLETSTTSEGKQAWAALVQQHWELSVMVARAYDAYAKVDTCAIFFGFRDGDSKIDVRLYKGGILQSSVGGRSAPRKLEATIRRWHHAVEEAGRNDDDLGPQTNFGAIENERILISREGPAIDGEGMRTLWVWCVALCQHMPTCSPPRSTTRTHLRCS